MSPADSLAVEGFQRAMLGWHEYYLLAGTAAVTLMGLLFVSLSIHIERVAHESGRHLEAMAREAFSSFLIVLFVSLMMLTPAVSRRPLSVSLIALGLFRGLHTLSRVGATLVRGARDTRFPPRTMILRFLFPLFGSALMIWAGASLARQSVEDGLALLMMSCVFLLADAARSSYELLVRTARDRSGEAKRG
jgi:hypothetical protein